MGVYCCVPCCKSQSGKSNISFNEFPSEETLGIQWITNISHKVLTDCLAFLWRKSIWAILRQLSAVLGTYGETGHNKDNVIQGQLDVPLSATGIRQAKVLGAHLRHQQYSHIYVSDLSRAKQTADGIVKQNLSYKGCLIHDSRLRERKFGDIEGKSFKYLKHAAGSVGRKIGDYTPPGGETVRQVHDRAVSFFQDLCQTVADNCVQLDKNNATYQTICSANCCAPLKSVRECSSVSVHEKSVHGKKRKGERLDHDWIKKTDCLTQSSQIGYPQTKSHTIEKPKVPCSNSRIASQNIEDSSSTCETDDQCNMALELAAEPVSCQGMTEAHVSSQAEPVERRLSVCSSGDDGDLSVEMVANVLVVSHGGFIRELLRYFVEELECTVPGGTQQALRISPNAALSKFTVSVEESGQNPRVICHQIHDKEYLVFDYLAQKCLYKVGDTAL